MKRATWILCLASVIWGLALLRAIAEDGVTIQLVDDSSVHAASRSNHAPIDGNERPSPPPHIPALKIQADSSLREYTTPWGSPIEHSRFLPGENSCSTVQPLCHCGECACREKVGNCRPGRRTADQLLSLIFGPASPRCNVLRTTNARNSCNAVYCCPSCSGCRN